MSATAARVKVLCIRPRPNPAMSPLLAATVDEWVHALALHCDVETIAEDFDLVEVHDRVKPDLLLFDAIHWARPHRLTITNIDAFPDLPRAFLANNDPHDPLRPLIMDMLADYGIDTIFCFGVEDLQQMQELRRANCFVLPKFIDSTIFREYDEARSIPVTIMGAHLYPTFYAWRAQVATEIQHVLPTLLYTHPGYVKGVGDPFEIRNEGYARMLSRSHFCVADTTRLDYVVRKHLEIPAAGSVLVAPESAPLREYGFVDMENCILGAPGAELYGRIRAVASDRACYERIRSNGHALVHGRYTRQAWTHILDWLACRRSLKPGQVIRQNGIFGRFEAVASDAGLPAIAGYAVYDNPLSAKLRAAREALLNDGDLGPVADDLREVMGWIGHVAEPWFMMGLVALAVGDLQNAREWLIRRSQVQGQADPAMGLLDPCEIAWLLLVAHLTADDRLFERMSACAAATEHLCIRRMQWLIGGAAAVADLAAAGLEHPQPGDRMSIHWLGDEDFDAWFGLIRRVLTASTTALAA